MHFFFCFVSYIGYVPSNETRKKGNSQKLRQKVIWNHSFTYKHTPRPSHHHEPGFPPTLGLELPTLAMLQNTNITKTVQHKKQRQQPRLILVLL